MSTTTELVVDDHFLEKMVDDPTVVHRGGGATIAESSRGASRSLVAAGTPQAVAALLATVSPHGIGSVTLPRGTWELLHPELRASLALPVDEDWDWMEIDHVPSVEFMQHVREIDLRSEREELDRVREAAIPTSFLRVEAPGSRWYGWFDSSNALRAIGGAIGGEGGSWPDGAHFGSIGTEPAYQGRGIGAALTAAMIALAFAEGATTASLGVYAENTRAITMYERLGFTTTYHLHSRERDA